MAHPTLPEQAPKRLAKSGLSYALDFVVERWATILVGAGGFAMSWLAAVNTVIAPYGAVAWGVVGIASALMLALLYWLLGKAHAVFIENRFNAKMAESATVNPLDGHFAKKRIRLSDFYNPAHRPVKQAHFQDCELFGPALVLLDGGLIQYADLVDCQALIGRDDARIKGAVQFVNCTFDRCNFFQVTFLVTQKQYDNTFNAAKLPILTK